MIGFQAWNNKIFGKASIFRSKSGFESYKILAGLLPLGWNLANSKKKKKKDSLKSLEEEKNKNIHAILYIFGSVPESYIWEKINLKYRLSRNTKRKMYLEL